jgi:hypothetical protein
MEAGKEQREPVQPPVAVSAVPLEEAVHSVEAEVLLSAARNPALTCDLALALLKRADLPSDVLEEIGKNQSLLKLRRVKFVLASHQRTPRHVSVPLVRQLYTFDLMKVALSPTVPADIKKMADETLISRLKTITLGERLTLARQASGRIAGALLLDSEPRIMQAALENPHMTEAFIVQAVLKPQVPVLVQAVSQHAKWSLRRDIQIALLRTEHLSLARALAFARNFSPVRVREILQNSRLPARVKDQLLRENTELCTDKSLKNVKKKRIAR